MSDFIGQDKIIKELDAISYNLKRNRRESVNIMLRGPAGCGKTLLASIFCKNIGGDFAYHLVNKEFIMPRKSSYKRSHILDEIHNMKKFEVLYPLLDSGKYVLVFCTTEFGDLPDPLTSRCLIYNFAEYTDEQLAKIVLNYSREIKLNMAMDTAFMIAKRAGGSPRKAKNYTKRIKFIIHRGYNHMTIKGVGNAFEDIGVLDGGYTDIDISYLKFLAGIGQASLKVISRTIGIDENTILNEIEPFLLENGHITISSRGRKFLGWKRGVKDDSDGEEIIEGLWA